MLRDHSIFNKNKAYYNCCKNTFIRHLLLRSCNEFKILGINQNLKEQYYCRTHPNLFLKERCRSCRGGMCLTCINEHKTLCPSCRKNSFRTYNYAISLLIVKRATAAGFIALGLYVLFSLPSLIAGNNLETQALYMLLFFGIGVSVVSVIFLLNDTDYFEAINKIPVIGFKLTLLTLMVLSVTGYPLFYYFKKVFLVIKARRKATRL